MPLHNRIKQGLPLWALVGLCVINYGWGMNRLGVHADDWFWFAEYYFGGFQGVVAYGAVDRLLIGVPFGLLGELVGLRPAFWHVMVVVLHICAVLLVWRLLLLWTEDNLFSTSTAALFAVYPAVSVVVWISRLPSILSLVLFLLSLLLSISVTTRPAYRRLLQVLAFLLAPISMLIYELPLALEPVRLLLMLRVSKNQHATPPGWLVNSFLRWLPFAIVWLLFLVWRLWLAPYVLPGSRDLGNGWPGLSGFISGLVQGLYQILLYSWRFSLGRLAGADFPWPALVLGALAAILVLSVGMVLGRKTKSGQRRSYLWAIMAGIAILLSGMSIPIAAGFPVPSPASLFTRVNSVGVIGAAMLMVGAVSWGTHWLRPNSSFPIVFGVAMLVGLGTANNIQVNESYIQSWNRQQDLWWQVAWRAPDLKAGTYLLVGSQESLSDLDNNQPPPWGINNPLALIYGNRSYGGEYLDQSTVTHLGPDGLAPALGSELILPGRLVAAYYGDGCLKFADPERSVQDVEDSLFVAMAPLSHLEHIVPGELAQSGTGLRAVVDEPSRGWCFYYQRAGYFAQLGDWPEVARVLEDAQLRGLSPANAAEWLPFIEAYLHLGDEAQAMRLLVMTRNAPAHYQDAIRARLEVVTMQAQDQENLELAVSTQYICANLCNP